MNLEEQIGLAQVVSIRFDQFRLNRAAELKELEDKPRRTPDERSRREHLRETLLQIDRGLHPNEGTDPELYALVQHPDVVSLRLARPGVQSVQRLLARLEQQRADEAAQKAEDAIPWVGSSRVDLQACKLEYSIVSPK